MTTDLRSTLLALQDNARAAAPDLAPAPVVTRARRRRALVHTGYGAVGAGAAAALAVGGVALAQRLNRPSPIATHPAPVVTPSPTPTTTASAATRPDPTPTWSPTASAPYEPDMSACGTTVGPGDVEGEGAAVYVVEDWSADPGQPLSLPWQIETPGAPGDRVAVAATGAYLTEGGVDSRGDDTTVIGVAATALPGPAARVLGDRTYPESEYATLELPLTLGFVMCPGADGAGGPPPHGDYLVWTSVDVVRDGSTSSAWGAAYGRIGPWTDNPTPMNYLPEGTTRYDATVDSATCLDLNPSRLGLTPEAWTPTSGPLTAAASARFENGVVVVSLRLANGGTALPYVDVRYPSFYVVANEAFASTYVSEFPPGTIVHASNTGRTFGSGDPYLTAPHWAPGATLGTGGSVELETATGPHTCATLWESPWASISYTVYAFTEIALPDGTMTRIQAAPITTTVP